MENTLSVVIPTYNRSSTVGESIESVLSQTSPADEIIVVDDGSQDDTPATLHQFGDRIRTVFQENGGVSAARNTGIRQAKGNWVAFLDSDDIWYDQRLETLRRDLSGTSAIVHAANMRLTGKNYDQDLFALHDIGCKAGKVEYVDRALRLALRGIAIQGVAARKDWLEQLGGFDTSMTIFEDMHLLVRLATVGPWLISGEMAGEIRRITNASLTEQANDRPVSAATMRAKVISDVLEQEGLSSDDRFVAQKAWSGALFQLSECQFAAGRRSEARSCLIQSARVHPSSKGWVKALSVCILGAVGYRLALQDVRKFLRSRAT